MKFINIFRFVYSAKQLESPEIPYAKFSKQPPFDNVSTMLTTEHGRKLVSDSNTTINNPTDTTAHPEFPLRSLRIANMPSKMSNNYIYYNYSDDSIESDFEPTTNNYQTESIQFIKK